MGRAITHVLAGGLAGAIAVAAAAPALADVGGPFRRFTANPLEVNRNERMVYVPLARAFTDAQPPGMPYHVAAATWRAQPLGSAGAAPDQILDPAGYVLESFRVLEAPGIPRREVVITRRPGFPGEAPPMIDVLHPENFISARATPERIEPAAGGMRYTFVVVPPLVPAPPAPDETRPRANRYTLRLLPAYEVRQPPHMVRAPTFGGAGRVWKEHMAPPRLPVTERVAGRRMEYRSPRKNVVFEEAPPAGGSPPTPQSR
jgi:hypothetical protein